MINIDNCVSPGTWQYKSNHTTKNKAEYVCLRMWKCDLGDYTYPLPASWSHCPLVAAYCTTAGCVSKSPKKFENMDSLLFYSPNSNPVWAHNGALVSESGERGGPQVWPPSLNSGFHAVGGTTCIYVHMCFWVSRRCKYEVMSVSHQCLSSAAMCWSNKERETICIEVSAPGVLTSKE